MHEKSKIAYLIKVVDTPFVGIIIQNYLGLLVLGGAHCSLSVQCSHKSNRLSFILAVGHTSMCVCEAAPQQVCVVCGSELNLPDNKCVLCTCDTE